MNDVFMKYDEQGADTKAVNYLQTQAGSTVYAKLLVSQFSFSLSLSHAFISYFYTFILLLSLFFSFVAS